MSFFDKTPTGLVARIRLTPSGRADAVDGLARDAEDRLILKASVTKAPENGKANQALIRMLAKEWKLAKSALEVLQGQTNRNKVLSVAGDADELAARLELWTAKKGLAS
ncbi:MAG: DUF167 domain-containing protein [Alphaproteobacteria bacterium]|nr:DUF167 domain-containing protein [Alphaproteobacteria bacterium]MBF0251189.1 DUF167 domain-containing protein [Alphaproteobacteria bacterium]